jgi:hypothetical protein
MSPSYDPDPFAYLQQQATRRGGSGGDIFTYLPTVSVAPVAVWSTSKLLSAYTGAPVSAYSSGAATTADIPFDGNNNLDQSAMDTLAGVVTIASMYDQTGNGYHMTQAVTALQPFLTALKRDGVLQPITFDTNRSIPSGRYLENTVGPVVTKNNYTIFIVARPRSSYENQTWSQLGSVPDQLKTSQGLAYGIYRQEPNGRTTGAAWLPPAQPVVVALQARAVLPTISLSGAVPKAITAPAADATLTGIAIGKGSSASLSPHQDIYAIVMYPSVLSDSETLLVKIALEQRFNIAARQNDTLIWDGASAVFGSYTDCSYNFVYQTGLQLIRPVTTFNMAVSGSTLSSRNSARSPIQVPKGAGKTIVVIYCGVNDLEGGTSAATAYTSLTNQCNAYRALGYKVIVSTLCYTDAATPGSALETRYNDFNAMVRAGWASIADGFADIASDSVIGTYAATLDRTINVDGTHWNNIGQSYFVPYYVPEINRLLAA